MTIRVGFHAEEASRLIVKAREGTGDCLPQNRLAEALIEAVLEVAAAIDRQTEEMGTTVEIRQETR